MPKKIAQARSASPRTSTTTTRARSKSRITFKTSSWYENAMRAIAIKAEPPPPTSRVELWNARHHADAD
jgi:hypothetical protein